MDDFSLPPKWPQWGPTFTAVMRIDIEGNQAGLRLQLTVIKSFSGTETLKSTQMIFYVDRIVHKLSMSFTYHLYIVLNELKAQITSIKQDELN